MPGIPLHVGAGGNQQNAVRNGAGGNGTNEVIVNYRLDKLEPDVNELKRDVGEIRVTLGEIQGSIKNMPSTLQLVLAMLTILLGTLAIQQAPSFFNSNAQKSTSVTK